jgi:uncharacterized protein
MKYTQSFYTIITDIIDETSENPERILFATRTGTSVKIKDTIYQKIVSQDFSNIDYETLRQLIDIEAIVLDGTNEFHDIIKQNVLGIESKNALSFTIQPSANCQFGCHYCGQKHSKDLMDEKIMSKVIKRIEDKIIETSAKSISVMWYGGEPLMGFSHIKKMSAELIEMVKRNGVSYFGSMITNGLSFKLEVFKELANICKVRHFQITLDGLAEYHDKRRITKKGENTFDIIFKNIIDVINSKEYIESKAAITIRSNIDKNNFESIPDLIDLMASHKFQEKNVTLDFCPVVNWGDNNAEKDSFEPTEFSSKEIDLFLYAKDKGFKTPHLPERSITPCMVVDPASEVYDAKGNIYPCYEFPYTPKYETDEYRIGNLLKPEETYNYNAITRNWNEDIKTNISGCPTCKLFPVCGGGCPKKWYANEKGCPSFKHNIEDRLVLDYLINNSAI